MITQYSIRGELIDLFAERMGIEVPSVETDLVAAGLLDSLAILDLLVHLEQKYAIRISLEDLDLESFRSVSRMAQLIVVLKGSNGQAVA